MKEQSLRGCSFLLRMPCDVSLRNGNNNKQNYRELFSCLLFLTNKFCYTLVAVILIKPLVVNLSERIAYSHEALLHSYKLLSQFLFHLHPVIECHLYIFHACSLCYICYWYRDSCLMSAFHALFEFFQHLADSCFVRLTVKL